MKSVKMMMMALAVAATMPAAAQFRRTPTPNDTLQSVRVSPKGDVTFSIYAPNAKDVRISAECAPFGQPVNVVKNDVGVWSATIPGVKDGVYRYNFVVDGVTVQDAKNNGVANARALAVVATDPNAFFVNKDVPHGAVAQRWYYSKTLKEMRRMHVWTPAGYEKSADKLPVLYLVHGGGDNDTSWPGVGHAGFILDNLLAEGKMVPMIVVMPNGSIDMPDGNIQGEVPVFAEDMIQSIIPYIEDNYRVLTDKDHRAMAGLSMGGMETMETALYHPEMFSYVWVLSSSFAPGNKDKYEAERIHLKNDAAKINANIKQLVFTQGGPEDIAYNNCKETLKLFDEAGIKYEFSEMPGGHSWHVWRHNLRDLAPRIFK